MNITVLTVGKTERNWNTSFSLVEIPDLKNVSSLSRDQIREKEGQLILKSLKDSDEVFLLDEKGKEYSSKEWASMLEKRIASGGKNIVFVIGGAYGFSDAVYKRAGGLVSLSRMTFSHQMVRTIFSEQLYRAFTIMKGEPYHHE